MLHEHGSGTGTNAEVNIKRADIEPIGIPKLTLSPYFSFTVLWLGRLNDVHVLSSFLSDLFLFPFSPPFPFSRNALNSL